MPAANVIRLRALLSDKFSGLRLHLGPPPPPGAQHWATGLPLLDAPLHGGLPKGALTEVVGPREAAGTATLLHELLRRAAAGRHIAAVIDGRDSLDATQLDAAALARLLWVRVRSAAAALKAADMVLRDGNFSLVLVDLKLNPEAELRKIPATTWHRFQRLVEDSAAVCVVFTPRPMVAARQARVVLQSRYALDALSRGAEETLRQLEWDITQARPPAAAAARQGAA